MHDQLTLDEIRADPARVSVMLQLPDGQPLVFRPLSAADSALLGQYFHSLSAETRRRFGPHPLDQATAEQLCAEPIGDTLRMIAVLDAPQPTVVAYLILLLGVTEHEARRYRERHAPLDGRRVCTVAPSVADAFQGLGLGRLLLGELVQVARRLDFEAIVLLGGTQASNQRAIRLYRALGFETVGSFEYPEDVLNQDMLLELERDAV